ncbi:MAG TPA: hypothetical protein VMH79_03335 [Thermoanaerobaculia bacterium]|nr:hypothetical protein [Thermoanaerobaculia bacterium]
MDDKRKAIRFGGFGLAVLFGGCLIALLAPRFQVAIIAASFAGYVACTRRALALCRADDLVFRTQESSPWETDARESVRAGLIAGSAGALSLGRSMSAPTARFGSVRRERSAYPRALDRSR